MTTRVDNFDVAGRIDVSRETKDRLIIYRDLLLRWQKRINLVGPSTISYIESRHFADCLQLVSFLKPVETVADLGSGAGFPGLIISILLADKGGGTVYLIESAGKKCAFLREVIRETKLGEAGVETVVRNGRIEVELPLLGDLSLITGRALAPLDKLLELTEGRISGNTKALLQKGVRYREEIKKAQESWNFDEKIHPSKVDGGSVIIELHNVFRK